MNKIEKIIKKGKCNREKITLKFLDLFGEIFFRIVFFFFFDRMAIFLFCFQKESNKFVILQSNFDR